MPRKAEAASRSKFAWGAVLVYSFRFTVAGALLVAALIGLYRVERYVVQEPRFRLVAPEVGEESSTLEIAGLRYASRAQVLRVFEPDFGRSVYLIPLKQRRAQLRSVDWVRDASIRRIWPNRVLVRIEERNPAAFIELPVDRFSRVALIDADGQILHQPAHSEFKLPVIAGVRPAEVEAARREKVRRLQRLMDDAADLGSRVSEADVSDRNNLVVTAKMDDRAVLLHLGDGNYGARLRSFVKHYPDIQKRMPDARRFDLRLDDRITVLEEKR
jgi:cell division protein FtsQ